MTNILAILAKVGTDNFFSSSWKFVKRGSWKFKSQIVQNLFHKSLQAFILEFHTFTKLRIPLSVHQNIRKKCNKAKLQSWETLIDK